MYGYHYSSCDSPVCESGLLSSPEFSIWLGHDLNPTSDTVLVSDGFLTLGGTNSSLFSGDIEFTDIALPANFWQVPVLSEQHVVCRV
jgi:hypothetical protein